jgi:alpha-L-rhamnosidase
MLCGSDASFRVAKSLSWASNTTEWMASTYRRFQEVYDARGEIAGWKGTCFDDSTWENATVYKGYSADDVPQAGLWSYMVPRDIPFMDESRTVYAEAVTCVQEHLDLRDRFNFNKHMIDLTHTLSQPGQPLEYTRVEEAQALCREGGETLLVCSGLHLDHEFDGIYSPSVLLDFGKVYNAYPVLVVEGEPGARLEMGFAERLVNGQFYNLLECPFGASYTLKGIGEETFVAFTWQTFRYVRIQLHDSVKGVRIKRFYGQLTRYPYSYKGVFKSGNEKYNALFESCRRTIELCSNEWLMDTPFREQGQYLGDVCAVTLGGIYACFGDTDMPSKYLRQSASNQMCTGLLAPVTNKVSSSHRVKWPDYSLEWIIALWEHYLYTGDEHWIHQYYPHAVRLAQYFLAYMDESGILGVTPDGPFIDWSFKDRRGPMAVMNALFYGALGALEKMARFKKDSYMEEIFRQTGQGIKAAYRETFYDEERCCVVDCVYQGEKSRHVSEGAAAAALWFGMLDEGTTQRVIKAMYEEKTVDYERVEPFFTWFVLRGLNRQNRLDLAMQIIDDRYIRLVVDRAESSMPEEWCTNGSWRTGGFTGFMRSHSHAWSACPAQFFLQVLPGIEILDPGGKRVRVRPQYAGFDYEAVYPLQDGCVYVSCQDGQFHISADEGIMVEEAC